MSKLPNLKLPDGTEVELPDGYYNIPENLSLPMFLDRKRPEVAAWAAESRKIKPKYGAAQRGGPVRKKYYDRHGHQLPASFTEEDMEKLRAQEKIEIAAEKAAKKEKDAEKNRIKTVEREVKNRIKEKVKGVKAEAKAAEKAKKEAARAAAKAAKAK